MKIALLFHFLPRLKPYKSLQIVTFQFSVNMLKLTFHDEFMFFGVKQGMIEQGFPTLAEFLERQQPDGPEILDKLKALHPEAGELLRELLKPPDPPAPSCLTHMDFWCNNLLFRRRTPPDGIAEAGDNGNVMNGHASAGEESSSDRTDTTECFILDWQMIAISRPTHDIALLLLTSLTPELRRANTEALLKHYWNVFQVLEFYLLNFSSY